ncbi:MAG: HAD-IIB family hydrolase [Phycisphaerales bacterium]
MITTRPPVKPGIDVLAIDLDGTLLDPNHRVSQRNIEAVQRARDAGITVLVCTGRGLGESIHAVQAIDQRDPVMVAGGSIIADPISGKTLHRFTLSDEVVKAATDIFHEVECPALVMKDPSDIDYDYLVLNSDSEHPVHPITQWWFDDHKLRVNYASHTHLDEHPQHTVRVGMCAESSISNPISAKITELLADEVWLYDFPCVTPGDHSGEVVHILELFAKRINKWAAISWYLEQHDIDPQRVGAIGDQINDVPMMERAGVGIAMGNAVDEVRAHARYNTATNTEDGVAVAIDAILNDNLRSLER